jgi:hypothetical protein
MVEKGNLDLDLEALGAAGMAARVCTSDTCLPARELCFSYLQARV